MSVAFFEVRADERRHACVIGLGLLGDQIVREMSLHCSVTGLHPVDWTSGASIVDALVAYACRRMPDSLDVVWSAGRGGFSASDDELEGEFTVFEHVMTWLSKQSFNVRVNLLSSAGGIYENQGWVSRIADVSPGRPYGHWKLRQERLLQGLNAGCRIYRISTVYGPTRVGGRTGMVSAILDCAHMSRPVTVYASENTLRDYVWSRDISRHIVERIHGKAGQQIELLAFGYPISIRALLSLARTITRRNVKAIFLDNDSNSKDIVFDISLVPANFIRTDMSEGLRLLNRQIGMA